MDDREQSGDESFAPGAAGPSRHRAAPHSEGLPTLHLRPAVLREIITSGFAEPAKAKVCPHRGPGRYVNRHLAIQTHSMDVYAGDTERAHALVCTHSRLRCRGCTPLGQVRSLAQVPCLRACQPRQTHALASSAGRQNRVARPKCSPSTWSVYCHNCCWTLARRCVLGRDRVC